MTANAEEISEAAVRNIKEALLSDASVNRKEIFERLTKVETTLMEYFEELEALRRFVHELAKQVTGSHEADDGLEESEKNQ